MSAKSLFIAIWCTDKKAGIVTLGNGKYQGEGESLMMVGRMALVIQESNEVLIEQAVGHSEPPYSHLVERITDILASNINDIKVVNEND